MTFTPHLSQLKRNGVTYLAGVTPSKRLVTALTLAKKFFERNNFVPGFPDFLIITTEDKLAKVRSKSTKLPFTVWVNSENDTILSPIKKKPDLVWIDDIEPQLSKKLVIKFAHVPLILSHKPSKNGLQILVDSREQSPLFIGNEFKRSTLYVGDYTTEKLLDKFHIERKSPQDLYGTITRGHRRFRDELLKASVNEIELVMVVECKKKIFINKEFKRGDVLKLTCDHIRKIIDTIEHKYKLPIYWCNNRDHCKKLVKKLLLAKQLIYGRKKS